MTKAVSSSQISVKKPEDKFCKELRTYIDSRHPFILVESSEEDRVSKKTRQLVSTLPSQLQPQVFEWSVFSGFSRIATGTNGKPIVERLNVGAGQIVSALEVIRSRQIAGSAPAIYLMKDVHNLLSQGGNIDPLGVRALRDLYPVVMNSFDTVLFVSPEMEIPNDLQKQIVVLDLPLPTEDELGGILRNAIEGTKRRDDTRDPSATACKATVTRIEADLNLLGQTAQAGRGLTAIEYDNAVAKGITLGELSPSQIIKEKKQIIRKSGVLEYMEPTVTMDQVGGLENYKEWLMSCVNRFKPEAREFGLEAPKGCLLVGPPGTGKSMLAELTAYSLNIAMARLEIAKTVSKWVGQSARNMKRALNLGHEMSPIVFFMDEGETLLAGKHEENANMTGVWLTDFEMHNDGMFTILTCNNQEGLRPEVLQRFERVFYVGAPSRLEREQIFAAKIRAIPSKIPYDPVDFDLPALAEATSGFVGREIRTVIKESLTVAYAKRERMDTNTIVSYLENSNIQPTTVQRADEINAMVQWARKNATNASKPDASSKKEIGVMPEVDRYNR